MMNREMLEVDGVEVEVELARILDELNEGIVVRMAEVAEVNYWTMLKGIKNDLELNKFYKATRSKALELLEEELREMNAKRESE